MLSLFIHPLFYCNQYFRTFLSLVNGQRFVTADKTIRVGFGCLKLCKIVKGNIPPAFKLRLVLQKSALSCLSHAGNNNYRHFPRCLYYCTCNIPIYVCHNVLYYSGKMTSCQEKNAVDKLARDVRIVLSNFLTFLLFHI